jgi:hypothetical protein
VKRITSSAIKIGLTAALLISASSIALADGMPFKEKSPEPAMTPLDKALNEIENKQPPIAVTKPAAAAEPAPVVAPAPEPKPAEAKAPELPKPVEETKPVVAAAPPVPEARVVEVQPNSGFFGLSVGMYDPFTHGRQAASLNFEFQPGVKVAGILQPLFGGLVTTNGALMGYGGVGLPIKLDSHWMLMPSVAVGAYHGGGGVDLDRGIGFRVGTELAYVYDDNSRIGLNFHVLTNGTSMGRSDRTEVIGLTYTVPFELFSGKKKELTPSPSAAAAPAAATTTAPSAEKSSPLSPPQEK